MKMKSNNINKPDRSVMIKGNRTALSVDSMLGLGIFKEELCLI